MNEPPRTLAELTGIVARGIPTYQTGYKMRSRLEARWAGFFDRLGWRWEYEPCDFDGWIPDFVLIGEKQNTFVEVKPVTTFPEIVRDQIDKSGCPDEVLIVGLGINTKFQSYAREDCEPYPPLGWLREITEMEDGSPRYWWQTAHFTSFGGMGFHPSDGGWHNRINGKQNGDHGTFCENYSDFLKDAWTDAANSTQWKAR